MMIHEFAQRTGYQPTTEEYHYIEESYYDFSGDKDAFCAQWKLDKEDGHWDTELKLRKTRDEQAERMEAQIEGLMENLAWYKEQYKKLKNYESKMRRIESIINE